MKIAFIDLETTGVKPWRNGIHQISGIIDRDGEIIDTFDFKVRPNPACEIDVDALKVSNVTVEEIMEYPKMEVVYKELIDVLSRYVDKFNRHDKFFFAGYNAKFDNDFLRGFFKANNDEYFGSWFWSNPMDVMGLATEFLKEKRFLMQNFQLGTVAKELGIETDSEKLHDGMYDIEQTRKMYYKIIGK